jgi:hypothetical protein
MDATQERGLTVFRTAELLGVPVALLQHRPLTRRSVPERGTVWWGMTESTQ